MTCVRYTARQREQAVRLVRQAREDQGKDQGVVARVARELGIGVESFPQWVKRADVDEGVKPGAACPCLRPIALRALRFAFSGRADLCQPGSVDSGFDEFRPSRRSRSASLPATTANWAVNSATRARKAAFCASSSPIRFHGSTNQC